MVAHQTVGADADGEDIGELLHAVGDPLLAMIKISAGEGVATTEKGAAYTAADAVIVGSGSEVDELAARLRHGARIADSACTTIYVKSVLACCPVATAMQGRQGNAWSTVGVSLFSLC